MAYTLTKDEKFVRDEITRIYPQLKINMRKVCGDNNWRWGDDLLAVAVTFFLEKPLETQLKTINNGKLENFITWIANMQLKSSSSYFYTRYRRPMSMSRELYMDYNYKIDTIEYSDYEEALQCIEEGIKEVPEPYGNFIMDLLFKHKTMGECIDEVPEGSITFKKNMNEYINQIQEKCQHCI